MYHHVVSHLATKAAKQKIIKLCFTTCTTRHRSHGTLVTKNSSFMRLCWVNERTLSWNITSLCLYVCHFSMCFILLCFLCSMCACVHLHLLLLFVCLLELLLLPSSLLLRRILLFSVIAQYFGSLLLSIGGLRAAETMHNISLTVILRSPSAFFDTTPVGRILSRFGSDVNTIDMSLPQHIRQALFCTFRVRCPIIINYFSLYII